MCKLKSVNRLHQHLAAVLMLGWLTPAGADNDFAMADDAVPDELVDVISVSEYQAQARQQARAYDRTRDISPWQLLMLLEVSERTGARLGQALATGEFESAGTWNDFVRPTLGDGSLGSASGVWQFIPNTFFLIIKQYGQALLEASAADPSLAREHLDLGAGPFSDAQVRAIIQETVDGVRDADDEQLQLLRHNFTVLAFAKHYLSVESGAKTPVEDYLFHFLGETRGRQILALASGASKHTLSVKQPTSLDSFAGGAVALADADSRQPPSRARLILRPASAAPGGSLASITVRDRVEVLTRKLEHKRADALRDSGSFHRRPSVTMRAQPSPDVVQRPRVSSEWGLPAESPIVTGNPGMFYRDASTKTDPYTWAEFMQALSNRVQAHRQPAMVRAKYGVGFELNGGDMPGWSLDDEKTPTMVEFRDQAGGSVRLAERLLTEPLDADEMQAYKRRLAELIERGEAEPLAVVPSSVVLALQHLGLLAPDVTELAAGSPELREALAAFRDLVGKDAPDDPALADRLMPAERVALEIYDRRLAQYAALQSSQQIALAGALDLLAINDLLKSHRRASRPHVVAVQKALDEAGLETQTQGHRGGGQRHFDGIAGKLTAAALDRFQLRNGLLPTQGRLDAITAATLGLPPLGPEIFFAPVGPASPIVAETDSDRPPSSPLLSEDGSISIYKLLQWRKEASPAGSNRLLAQVGAGADALWSPEQELAQQVEAVVD